MSFMREKGHYKFKLHCNVDQSAVTNASVKLLLALVTSVAKHRQQSGEWCTCVYQFILFFQFKVISLFN